MKVKPQINTKKSFFEALDTVKHPTVCKVLKLFMQVFLKCDNIHGYIESGQFYKAYTLMTKGYKKYKKWYNEYKIKKKVVC